REDGTIATPQFKKPATKAATVAPAWMWPLAVTVVCVVAIGVGGFLYLSKMEMATPSREAPPTGNVAAATPGPAVSAPPPAGSAAGLQGEDAAKTAALDQCSKRAEAVQSPRKCELYAVGNTVVYAHGLPPMPPAPWVKHDASTERPFTAKDMPLVREQGRERLDKNYLSARKSKSIALGPGGQLIFYSTIESIEEANRRSLEACGALAGVPCMIVVSDDAFVVAVPAS